MSESESTTGLVTAEDFGSYDGERNGDGERHGFGTATFANGDVFQGHYVKGKRNGQGRYRFSQAQYSGEYSDGERSGKGTMHYPDGGLYEGDWHANMKHGHGRYLYPNGDEYDGQWSADMRDGLGTYTFKGSKAQHNGYWRKGARHGPAEWITSDYTYKGHFDENLQVGRGKYIFTKGAVQPTALHGKYAVKSVVKQNSQGQEHLEDETVWTPTSYTVHTVATGNKIASVVAEANKQAEELMQTKERLEKESEDMEKDVVGSEDQGISTMHDDDE